jgi:hypothetical protein
MDTKTFLRDKLMKLERDAAQFAYTSEPMLLLTKHCSMANGACDDMLGMLIRAFITSPNLFEVVSFAVDQYRKAPMTDEEREECLRDTNTTIIEDEFRTIKEDES